MVFGTTRKEEGSAILNPVFVPTRVSVRLQVGIDNKPACSNPPAGEMLSALTNVNNISSFSHTLKSFDCVLPSFSFARQQDLLTQSRMVHLFVSRVCLFAAISERGCESRGAQKICSLLKWKTWLMVYTDHWYQSPRGTDCIATTCAKKKKKLH